MARLDPVQVNVNDAARKLGLKVELVGMREYRLRTFLTLLFLRFAGMAWQGDINVSFPPIETGATDNGRS